MRDEDRVFLAQYATSTCLTHPIAALALYRAAVDASEVAVVTESLMHQIPREQAKERAAQGRTDALVQTHVVARLLAELAAAIEDCGAIGDAVRYRDRKGVFRRYLTSQAGAVGDFWDAVLKGDPLADLFAFPKLEDLSRDEDREHIAYDYEEMPKSLGQIADIYRGQSGPGIWPVSPSGTSHPDVVNVVIDVVAGAAGGPPAGTAVTLRQTYNKLKHRFTVVDPVDRLARAVGAQGDVVIAATYPRDPPHAERLLTNICTVARVSGEIAALTYRLDELGALPPGC
jgi:hypothetical protein